MFKTKRIDDPSVESHGRRVLCDGMWLRGRKKQEARLEEPTKPLVPSSELPQWFGHDLEQWPAFQQRCREGLSNREAPIDLLHELKLDDVLTFLPASKDQNHDNPGALRGHLEVDD